MHTCAYMCAQKHKHMCTTQDTHDHTNVIVAEIFTVEFQKWSKGKRLFFKGMDVPVGHEVVPIFPLLVKSGLSPDKYFTCEFKFCCCHNKHILELLTVFASIVTTDEAPINLYAKSWLIFKVRI